MNDPTVTTSPTFKSLLSQLRTLSLHIVSEWDEADPEKSLSFFEVHDFTAELPGTWLGPCAANLEHLKLYFDHYVGYCPLLDLRNLHFPKLKTLSLGNFVFSHNWQLDWILSHAATLEELYMDNCPILFAIRTYGGLQAEGYIPPSLVPNGGITHRPRNKEEIWFYDRLWHHYFAAFEQHLHQLRHFRFGSGDWSDDRAFEEAEALPLRLTEDRYKVFDIGTHPCHHTPASVDWRPADKTWYVRPRCSEEDRDAYISLLSRIGQAAPLDFLIKLFPS